MKVVIIGAGNVATVLGKKIKDAGNIIVQVLSKTSSNAQKLAGILGASSETDLNKIDHYGDLYIISVSDNFVEETAGRLQLGNKAIVHTAGSVSKNVLKSASGSYGVIYPLQSLKKEMSCIPPIPVLIDGNTAELRYSLEKFCAGWASQVSSCDDEQRLKLHAAAVVTSNFTNYLYTLSREFCLKENLDFKTLIPLIEETASRIKIISPEDVQTGPAIRGDTATIAKHIDMLSAYPLLKTLYIQITQSIRNYYSKSL